MLSPCLFWTAVLEITVYLPWPKPWFPDAPFSALCSRQNSKMTTQDPCPYIISSLWLWEGPVMMRWYHNITPIIRFCYLAQLTLRKEIRFSGSDLIKLTFKRSRLFPATEIQMREGFNRREILHCWLCRWNGAQGKELWMASRSWEWPHAGSQQRNGDLGLSTARNWILLQLHELA